MADIILESEFREILGDNFINILSQEQAKGYSFGVIDEKFLKANISDFSQKFYVCGPQPMVNSVLKQLSDLGVAENSIIIEL